MGGSSKVFCLPSADTSVTDKFCMEYGIATGSPCGTTSEYNYLGYCTSGNECLNGVCAGTTTTTTTTTTTNENQKCIPANNACWENAALVNEGVCCDTMETCVVTDPMGTNNC